MKILCFKLKSLLSVFLITAVTLAVAVGTFTLGGETVAAVNKNRLIPVYSVERDDKKIAISFDCAWGTEHTDDILTELDRANVKCTFFAVQFWVEKYPEYARKVVERGHELGTHSKTHPQMSKLSKAEVQEELRSSSDVIENTVGIRPTLFRPPYGDYGNTLLETAKELGLYTIQWDVDSLDWKDLSASQIAKRILDKTKSGSIILCHNNGLHTAEALPIIFSALKNKGFTFVPIGELIYRENYYIDASGRQRSTTPNAIT